MIVCVSLPSSQLAPPVTDHYSLSYFVLHTVSSPTLFSAPLRLLSIRLDSITY
jgi:hypothetical protein